MAHGRQARAVLGADEYRREEQAVAQRHRADGEGEAQRLVVEIDGDIDRADRRLRGALLQALDQSVGRACRRGGSRRR